MPPVFTASWWCVRAEKMQESAAWAPLPSLTFDLQVGMSTEISQAAELCALLADRNG